MPCVSAVRAAIQRIHIFNVLIRDFEPPSLAVAGAAAASSSASPAAAAAAKCAIIYEPTNQRTCACGASCWFCECVWCERVNSRRRCAV